MEITMNKIAAGVVGIAMIAGLGIAFTATQAHAVTLTELVELFIALEVIPADKADEARTVLAGEEEETTTSTAPAGTGTAGAVACTGTFARNLTVGDTGADVKELQQLLNSRGFTVAVAGAPGSAGMETSYFGPATKSGVTAMQTAYAGEILAPLGLTAGTGFFGASTRAKANALCSAGTTPTVPGEPGDDDDDDDDTDSSDLSGEASINVFEINSADDDTIEEGDEEAAIAELNVEFSDGDAMITRLDVSLVGAGDEQDPWDTFDTIALMVDDEVVAEVDASDKDEYLDENDGTIRFTGLDIVAMEDEEIVVTVVATVANSVDGTNNGEAWTVSVDSMRFVDGDDVTSTEDSGNDFGTTVGFTIEKAGANDEIIVKTSTSDLDSSIIKVERDNKSDWVTIFVFDIDTDDSVSDITINEIPVAVKGSIAYSTLVDDARLVIDGTTVDSTTGDVTLMTTSVANDTARINFDTDGDVVIDAGDRVKAELQVRFKALAEVNEGATVQGMATSGAVALIDAEGADDLTGNALSGSATGDAHQLMTAGIYAEIVSVDTDTKSNGTVDDSVGEFTIKFDVTAFEDDYYLSATNTAAYDIDILLGGVDTATTSYSVAISSTASKTNNAYLISDGETETMTLTITLEPGAAGNYSALLKDITYGDLESAPLNIAAPHAASPAEDFETDPVYINA